MWNSNNIIPSIHHLTLYSNNFSDVSRDTNQNETERITNDFQHHFSVVDSFEQYGCS